MPPSSDSAAWAPKVTLEDEHGRPVALESLWRQGPLVVFFYPKDNTPGCTKQVCQFRDAYDAFAEAGGQVVGISADGQTSHASFSSKHALNFRLLSDPSAAARKGFGVKKTLGILPGRVTFVIDQTGKICHSFSSQTDIEGHVSSALKVVKALVASQPSA